MYTGKIALFRLSDYRPWTQTTAKSQQSRRNTQRVEHLHTLHLELRCPRCRPCKSPAHRRPSLRLCPDNQIPWKDSTWWLWFLQQVICCDEERWDGAMLANSPYSLFLSRGVEGRRTVLGVNQHLPRMSYAFYFNATMEMHFGWYFSKKWVVMDYRWGKSAFHHSERLGSYSLTPSRKETWPYAATLQTWTPFVVNARIGTLRRLRHTV